MSNATRMTRPVGYGTSATTKRGVARTPRYGTSATARKIHPGISPEQEQNRQRPKLRLITSQDAGVLAKKRPKIQYAIVAVLGFAIIMFSQLGLSLLLSDGAYQLARLKTQTVQIQRTTADLSQKIEVLSSPQNLAVSAEKLGMVSATRPAFLNLETGKVTAGVKNIGKGASLLGKTSVSNIALEKLGYLTLITPTADDEITYTPNVTTPQSGNKDPHSTGVIEGPRTN